MALHPSASPGQGSQESAHPRFNPWLGSEVLKCLGATGGPLPRCEEELLKLTIYIYFLVLWISKK